MRRMTPFGGFRRYGETGLRRATFAATLLMAATLSWSAGALSEIKPDDTPGAGASPQVPAPTNDDGIRSLPLPPPPGIPGEARPAAEEPDTPTPAEPTEPEAADATPVPEIIYDLERLTAPARRMRELILEATKSGELEKLRPLLGMGDSATLLSLGGMEGDAIEHLKTLSGDSEGQEILAILEEVLEAGFVHLDAGSAEELYVWPYFFAVPLDSLTAPQRVELFRIVTAGDYEDMKQYGAYVFYRVGITPDGHWSFFVAGD